MSALDPVADGASPAVGSARDRPGGVRGLLLALTSPLRGVLHWWRRSIQVRVVAGVLVLSTVLALLAGWLLLHQVTSGLVDSKRQTALTQAAAGFETARGTLSADDLSDDSDLGSALNQLIDVLAPRDPASDDYSIVVVGPLSSLVPGHPGTWAPRNSGQFDVAQSIPVDLVRQVRRAPGTWYAYTSIRGRTGRPATSGSGEPALVIGSQVVATTDQSTVYGVLYVFPLDEQQQTLSVVERGLFVAGLVLVVLLGTIAWLVTRQVVTPVRLARRIAERLADGKLEERMHVRGEDDIARLGQSFNKMAAGLQRQIGQLEELSRVQRRFVADVSHELRTPLTTVRMASDLLYESRDQFDGPTSRSAELLHHELDRFESLLSDLLEISRFDAGAAGLERSDVDMRDVVARVVDATSVLARRRGTAVVTAVPDRPAVVRADVRRVERIVRNLVGNAIQYGLGHDVEVGVTADDACVTVTVRDHGIGLGPGEEQLVFGRFWRADPARTRTRGGTGLGLSIALEDTALHGGRLEARGARDRGAMFRLMLPRTAGGPLPQRPFAFDGGRPAMAVGGPYARLGPGTGQES